jgi:O-antigen ligase
MTLVLFALLGISFFGIYFYCLWKLAAFEWLDKICTYIVIALPFERLPSLPVGGANIRFSQILVLLGFSVFLILLIKRDTKLQEVKINAITYFLLGFLLVSIPSWFQIIELRRFFVTEIATVIAFGATFLLAHFAKDIYQKIILLTKVMIGVGLFGLYQFFGDLVGLPPILTGLREQYTKAVFGIPRIQATALEPLYFAGMLFLPIFTCLFFILAHKKLLQSKIPYTNLYILLFFLCLLLLTVSKAAILLVGVMIVIIGILMFKRMQVGVLLKSVSWLGGFLAVIGGVAIFFSQSLFTILQGIWKNFVDTLSGSSTSAIERFRFFDTALLLLPANILIGIGSGQYGVLAQRVAGFSNNSGEGYLIVNNVYVEVWLEHGFLALIVLLTFLLYPLIQAVMYLRLQKDFTTKKSLTLLILGFTLLTLYIQWFTFSPVFIMPIFIILGMFIAGITEKDDAISDSAATEK